MPRPAYLLLSRSAAIDPKSGHFSVFEIVDRVGLFPTPTLKGDEKPVIVPYQPLRAIAVWMIEEGKGDKYEDTYEQQFRIHIPSVEEPITSPVTPFIFGIMENGKLEKRPYHRFDMSIEGPLPFQGPGVLLLECRIRKAGTDSWLSQDYPVTVEAAVAAKTGEKLPTPPG